MEEHHDRSEFGLTMRVSCISARPGPAGCRGPGGIGRDLAPELIVAAGLHARQVGNGFAAGPSRVLPTEAQLVLGQS